MEIQHLGLTSFILKTKKTTIIIDPLSKDTATKVKKERADIVLMSRPKSSYFNCENVSSSYLVDCPGEYEIKGIMVFGYPAFDGSEVNVVYQIMADEISIVHLGGLTTKPKDGIFDELGSVDILLVPVGNMFSLDAKIAKDVINSLNPAYAIPCNYKLGMLVSPLKEGLEKVEKFLELMDVKKCKKQAKFKIEKRQIKKQEERSTEIVVLTASEF